MEKIKKHSLVMQKYSDNFKSRKRKQEVVSLINPYEIVSGATCRTKEMNERNDQIKKNIEERDYLDETRKESPLKKADDAIYVDTTGLNIEQVIDTLKSYL